MFLFAGMVSTPVSDLANNISENGKMPGVEISIIAMLIPIILAGIYRYFKPAGKE